MLGERKSRVLMLVENCPYPQDTRVRSEAQALRDAGYGVSVISPASKGQRFREVIDGVEVFRYPETFEATRFWGYLWEYGYSLAAIGLLSLLVWIRNGFDIVHTANPPDLLVFVAAFYKLAGKKLIFDHHDLSPEMYEANFEGAGNRLVHRVLVWLETLSCRLADHVIATNESYKQMEMMRSGIPADRITVVRNGPNLYQFPVDTSAAVAAPGGKALIAYVGSMGMHDGIDCLLRSLRHMIVDLGRTDFRCVLIGGRGGTLDRLMQLKTELRLDDYVTFTGWVSEEEKRRILSNADICVDPDPWNPFNDKSTMIKVAEYMAYGKPIVGFDLRENRFTAQEAGLFVSANDELAFARALAELIDDPARRREMGAFGRRRVENELAWRYSVPKLLFAYAAVLQGSLKTVPRDNALPASSHGSPK